MSGGRPAGPPAFARRIALARAALLWERLWPRLWPPLGVAGLLLALALLEIPELLPPWAHAGLLAAFGIAFAAALWRGARGFAPPTRAEALRRLETASGLSHRPLGLADERQAAGADDPLSRGLWEAHRRRAEALAARLKVGTPRSDLVRRDPWGLRQALVLVLALGLVSAGRDAPARITRALDPGLGLPSGPPPVVDAWLSPPAYTGLPPVFLVRPAGAEGDGASAAATLPTGSDTLKVPTGSVLTVKLHGGHAPSVVIDGTSRALDPLGRSDHQIALPITEGKRLALMDGSRSLGAWDMEVVPDQPPAVAFVRPPEAAPRAQTRIEFQALDDYGVTALAARIERDGVEPAQAPAPVEVPLPLSAKSAKEVKGNVTRDLSAHPWAGLPVIVHLVARDGAGQEALSEAEEMVLPERNLRHPVAKALIAQRKVLVAAPGRRDGVAAALNRISEDTDAYNGDVVAYLAMRGAFWRLVNDQSPGAIAPVIDMLWDVALRIEDGGRSQAERDLDQAQEALKKAIENGASDQEIDRLTQELKEAMNRYLDQLMKEAERRAAEGEEAQPPDPNARMLSQRDLEKMLDRAKDLGKTGSRDAAKDMLSQLQQMLENLRANPRMGEQRQGDRQGAARTLRELGDLMDRQQRLRDQSFRRSQQERRQGERDQSGGGGGFNQEQGAGKDGKDGGNMAGEQEALRRALGEIMRKLGEGGGQIPEGLGRAERAMRDARDALGRGEPGDAVEPQGEALNQLRQGAQNMARDMERQTGSRQRDDQGPGGGDPLGRPLPSDKYDGGDQVKIPEESEVQRARAILDELQRRAGERERPPAELDYIDRLLRRF
jgi:uncharacterized protein (TIGR02302 family)